MKKLYFLLIFWFFLTKANAQWVTIPDPFFRSYLQQQYGQCFNGNLMDTTCLSIVNANIIYMPFYSSITNLEGIQYFDNLQYLYCNDNQLTTLPQLPVNLRVLDCYNNQLVILPAIPDSLEELNCAGNQLTNLPNLPTTLKKLNIGGNQFTSLPNLPNSLIELNMGGNNINSVTSFPDSLRILQIAGNPISTLPILPNKIKIFTCGMNPFTTLPNLPDSLEYFECNYHQLTSLPPIPAFLRTLKCQYGQLISLPPLPNLIKQIWCKENQISYIPNLPDSLTDFVCSNNQLTSLPTLPTGLKRLWCGVNQLTSLSSLPDSLQNLVCWTNNLDSLPNLNASLINLGCDNNNLSFLPAFPQSLKYIGCSNNQLSAIPTLPNNILALDCSYNNISSLPNLPVGIQTLYCSNNQIDSLPFLPNSLGELRANNNLISYIPNFPDTMEELQIAYNPNLKCLPKLGRIFDSFIYSNTGIQCLPNYIVKTGPFAPLMNPNQNIYPICDIINQNNCDVYWNIKGNIYSDSISNCQLETVEKKFKNIKVQLFQNGNLLQQVYSNDTGLYVFDTDTGTFTYSVDTIGLPLFVTCPVSGFYSSNLTSTNLFKDSMDFAVECKNAFDVGVNNIISTAGQFFPGNIATINVAAGDMTNNYGLSCAIGLSGSVVVELTGPISFAGVSPGALTPLVTNNFLTYNISDFGLINFFTDFIFLIQTNVSAQAGDQVCFTIYVNPLTGDIDSTNNYLRHCFTIVNSFDPNDKQVFPSGDILPDHEWLTYTIRFQNTGTAPAQHIYILDTLDTNLDVSTFTLLSYSHDNLTQVIGNVVKFNFPNINLPDSTNDEPNSHGYVQYKIKLNPGLPIGTTISNTAYNFFDFNPPVVTNTVVNQIYFLNPTITPNNLILCPNESDTLWTQVYDSYQWFKDGNLITGATQQFLVVDYFNDSGSQFMVEVDSAGVIAQSAPVLVDGWAFLPPFVIQEGNFTIGPLGEMIICPGDTAYLILGLPYDTNIQWTDNGVAITGANDDTLIVTQAGLYNVSGSPSQCPNYVQSLFDDIQVVIASPLSPTITPNNLILCPNESDTLWTQQFTTYQWYKDGNLIPGETNQYLVVDAFNDAGSQFSVEVTQGSCTGTSSQVLVDGWAFLPPFVISEGDFTTGPNGEMLVCPGDTAYLILGLPYDTNIQWTNNGTAIPGANDDTLVVTQSGMYHVSGAPSICPNFVQNLGVTIEVIVQGPPTPVITYPGFNLETQPGFANYQWYLNGNPVGTNTNIFPSPGPGMYTVVVTDANGCTAESQVFIISGIIESSVSGIVNVNYNSQTTTLQITRSNTTTETEIFVSDVLGRMIADEKISRGISEIEIKLNNIKPGIYFVNLSEGGSVKFFVE